MDVSLPISTLFVCPCVRACVRDFIRRGIACHGSAVCWPLSPSMITLFTLPPPPGMLSLPQQNNDAGLSEEELLREKHKLAANEQVRPNTRCTVQW